MKKSSKVIVSLLAVLIISLLVIFILYIWPTTIDKSYSGIMLRTGDTILEYSESITVIVKGEYTKRLFRGNIFNGQFQIIGLEMDDIDDFSVNILFDRKGRGEIVYIRFNKRYFEPYEVGVVYIGDKWDDMLITISDTISETTNSKHSNWSAYDGTLIALPSNNREEALIVANKILQKWAKPTEVGLMK